MISKTAQRKDAIDKVTGKCLYTDDLPLENCLVGFPIGAPVAKGILKQISFDPNYDWSKFTIVTGDMLDNLGLKQAFSHDEPILTTKEINYYGQPIALIAHKQIENIKDAFQHITFEIDEKEPKLSAHINEKFPKESVFAEKLIEKGKVDQAFKESDQIFEEVYETPAQEHYYLETQIVTAKYDVEKQLLTVTGSMQAPFNIKHSLDVIFKNKIQEVIVEPITCGGAFGGREDYTTQLAIHASILAMVSGKPVKIKLDRQTDMRYSTKRHPSSTKIRVGLKDNKIHAYDIDFILDGGAYKTISGVVLNRAMLHVSSFETPNIRVRGRAVQTNMPPNGAFRGFGAPQVFYASQCMISHVCKILNVDQLAFLNKNLIKAHATSLSGQKMNTAIGLNELFNKLMELSKFETLKAEINDFNSTHASVKRGIGIANVFHGTGYTGLQDVDGHISIRLHLQNNGDVEIHSSVIEFGQGAHTVLPLIAAKILNIPADKIKVVNINTKITPNSGPTVASRTSSLLGMLTEKACLKLKNDLGNYADINQYLNKCIKLVGKKPYLEITQDYTGSDNRIFDEATLQGEAYESYSQASLVVVTETDLITFNTRVIKIFGVFDAGNIVDETSALGQAQGGMVQGMGYALYEGMKTDAKKYITDSLSTYILPTAWETPEMIIEFVKSSNEAGKPRGLGELPIDGMAPAITDAVENALGLHITSIPISPEKLLELINRKDQVK